MPQHDYRFRIYEADDTTIDVTIDSGAIAELPASFGAQRIDVLQGRSESLNWTISILQELTVAPVTTFSQYLSDAGGRTQLLQRRCALQRQTTPSGFTTVAGGRILNIAQDADSLVWQVEVGNELWIARNTQTFTKGGATTKVYPPGVKSGWKHDYSTRITGTPSTNTAASPRRVAFAPQFRIPATVASLIKNDARPGVAYSPGTTNPYYTLRARYGDSTQNYHVQWLGELEDNTDLTGVWLYGPTSQLPANTPADFYLHMPNHAVEKDFPLHIGESLGGGGVHPFTFLKSLYDGEYQLDEDPDDGSAIVVRTVRYSTATLSDLADNSSIVPQQQWHRIRKTQTIADAAERYVYRPTGYVPALDNTGAIKPVRVRLPTADEVPSTTSLYEFDASNATVAPSWEHKSKDQVTAVEFTVDDDGIIYPPGSTSLLITGASLDHTVSKEFTIARRSARLEAGEVVRREVGIELPSLVNSVYATPVADAIATDTFTRYEDGPQYTRLHSLEGASTVTVGDLVLVNVDTFPNTADRTLGGTVMMQVVSRAVTPTGYTFDLLHVGAELQPLSAPSITLNRSTSDPQHTIDVILAGGTTAETAEVQFARSAVPPTPNQYATVATIRSNLTVSIGELRSGTKYYGRARLQRTNRIRSGWSTADSTSTEHMTAPSNLASTAYGQNWVGLTWTNGEADEYTQIQNSTQGIIGTLPAGSVEYQVAGLESDYTYVFRARHKDQFGGYSGWSTQTSVHTSTAGSTSGTLLSCARPAWLSIAAGNNSLTSRVS